MRFKVLYTYNVIALIIVIAFCISCSTKKNTFTRRLYHNTTARYNGYFNGNESFKTGVAELAKLHVDDYSKILSIYKLGTAEQATSLSSNFDKAYTKASTVIQRHSIFIKRKEHVRWIPEAYILIGKSYFYKQEYKLASETFDYIIKRYSEYPIKYNAMLWLARTYIQLKKYEKAESMLDLVQNKIEKKQVPKSAIKEFPLVYADYQIKQEKYEPSIEYLISGIDLNKKKQVRTRLRFILAQIYQKTGKVITASKLYDKVIKMNPPYEMAFNAKINKAICFDATTGSSKEIKKLLNKMARDSKNKDYLDQIYYALAEICMKEKDTACAIYNYKLSAAKSVSNNNQKATSFLKLANLYFEIPKYKPAQAYYDSAMKVLPKDYPDYNKISTLSEVLKNLVTNINIVELQDSLQNLSKMTPSERNKIIDDIITNVINDEKKKKEEEYLKQQNISSSDANLLVASTNSSWYFYNPNSLNFGKTEFAKKWGSRKLEDLWRLSNKQQASTFNDLLSENDSTATDSATTTASANPLKDRNYYLKNIPTSEEDIKKSDDKIVEALYNIGLIYQGELNDIPEAIETYNEIIKRFPDNNDYILKTYYQLYLAFSDIDDETKSNYYKNLICTKYADSDYCNIIKNPNFKKITTSNKDIAENLYKETYNAYIALRWDSVITKSNRAINLFGADTSLIPKFTYLRAVSYGKNKDSINFIKNLQLIIDKYPQSSVKPKAQNLLDFYTGKSNITEADSIKNEKTTSVKTYKFDENAVHLYVMIITVTKSVKITDVKNALSDFNTKNFSTNKLTVSNIFLDNTRQIITINNFENKTKAMLYYNSLKTDKDILSNLKSADYKQFIISVDNYPLLYKNKDIDNYYQFFTKNYLK